MNVASLLTTSLMLATAFSAFGQESVASPPNALRHFGCLVQIAV
jgi:hypothetical protein